MAASVRAKGSPGKRLRAESDASTPKAPGGLSRLAERCRTYIPCPNSPLRALCSAEGRTRSVVVGVSAPVPPSCGSHCVPSALRTDAIVPGTSLWLGKLCLPPSVLWQEGPGAPTLLLLPAALCTQRRREPPQHRSVPARPLAFLPKPARIARTKDARWMVLLGQEPRSPDCEIVGVEQPQEPFCSPSEGVALHPAAPWGTAVPPASGTLQRAWALAPPQTYPSCRRGSETLGLWY